MAKRLYKKQIRKSTIKSLSTKLKEALNDASLEDDFDAEAETVLTATPLDTVIDALDDDIADTLEDTSDDIEGIDPTTLENESASRKSNGLPKIDESKKNDKTKLEEEAYTQIVRDWVAQGGDNKDLEGFLDFAKGKGYVPAEGQDNPKLQSYKLKKAYRWALMTGATAPASENAPAGGPSSAPAVPVQPKEPHQNSAALNNLISLVGEVDDHVATAAETVNEKFRLIKSKVRRVMTGKSLKNYYLLFGDAGIGKSYLVNECLEETGLKGNPGVFKARGDLGANPSAVAAFLYQNRNRDLIILDDCDSMVMKNVPGNVSNMLKGALDPDGHEITISPTIAKNATNLIGKDQIGDDDIDLDSMPEGDANFNDGDDEKEMMPTQFDWSKPHMIMISNANEYNINEALLSRCDYYCLHLTQEEYLVRLAIVIKKMKFDNPNYTDQQYEDAKNIVYSVMTACIEAANNNIPIAGINIRLTHSLEFRIIRTLVDAWLSRVEDIEFTEHLDHEAAMKKAYKGFVKFDVAPLL